MSEKHHIEEERLSLASLIKNFESWIKSMFSKWIMIIAGSLIIGGLFFVYQQIRTKSYKAETTFVLQNESGAGLGQLSSLASLAGVNVGGLTESSGLFQIDNIIELYTSYSMLKQTLLATSDGPNGKERLVSWFGRTAKYTDTWNELGIDFEIPDDQFVVKHDSVLKEIVEVMRERSLIVSKPNRKLTILGVAFSSKNEMLAKSFNETLVRLVNNFYLKVKTRKTGENLRVLGVQADSVKRVLDFTLSELAKFEEGNANLNPLRAQARVPLQKIQIDLQASSAVYQEIVKNLEIAKVAHRNNTPLIQVIDKPILPLEHNRMKWHKALILGLALGGVMMVGFYTLKRIYTSAMTNN